MATANLLQTSVSGGTQNALSLQGDGVFFPKASTTSRLALTLTTTDKGFIVYDTTDNNIYFWNGAAWESVPSSGDAGANGSVQYNDNGIVSGATNFVWDKVNGRVGIGTATPAAGCKLDVNGAIAVRGANPVFLYNTDNTAGFQIYNSGATGATNSNCVFLSGAVGVRATLDASGNFNVANGNVILGTSGKGIDFSAVTGGTGTATANVLNDYEEGTFLPTVIGTTSAGTATYAAQIGRYTKVGRIVQFQIDINYSAGTGTGNLQIAGLPFQNSNNLAPVSTYAIDIALGASYYAAALIGTVGTKIDINQLPTGGGADAVVNYDAAGRIILSGTYTV
jgi:hypothetical protein